MSDAALAATHPGPLEKENSATTKQAFEHVLTGKKSMPVPAIIEQAVPLATGLKGEDPGPGHLLDPVLREQEAGRPRVERGVFKLNPKRKKATVAVDAPRKRRAAAKAAV